MILFSHPTLNANAKTLINGLYKNKNLYKLYTCIAVFPGQFLFKLGKNPKLKDLKRRSLDKTWRNFTVSKSFFEFGRLLASKLHLEFLLKRESGFFCVDRVYEINDKLVANNLIKVKKEGIIGVYAYEDLALATFTKVKQLEINCIYDLPIGYWKSTRLLMQKEFELNLDWSSTLIGFNDSQAKLNKKDLELSLADVIFVASSTT